jgi:hypothetical protein
VVYFQEGIVGWLVRVRPGWFGIVIDAGPDGEGDDRDAAVARAEAAE